VPLSYMAMKWKQGRHKHERNKKCRQAFAVGHTYCYTGHYGRNLWRWEPVTIEDSSLQGCYSVSADEWLRTIRSSVINAFIFGAKHSWTRILVNNISVMYWPCSG
jgi:hypothetical protein